MIIRTRLRTFVAAAVVVAASVTGLAAQRGQGRGPAWTLLGSRTVTDKKDHDTIAVTAARGSFNKIKLEVAGHAVDFQRVVIHFRNGDDQKLELRNTIPAGGSSRDIDIEGTNRIIKSIDFWYDANTIGKGGHAVVKTFGRH